MKIALLLCSLFLAAALAPRVYCQSPLGLTNDPTQPSDPDDGAPLTEPRHIGIGMTPDDVVVAMHGEPNEKLSAHIWVYWHFQVPRSRELQKYETLVVHFSPERVHKYRLVERKMVAALLADIRKTPTPGQPEMISECPREPEPGAIAPSVAPRRIGCGMSPDDVVRAMQGTADERPAPDVWIYWNFRADADPATPQPDTLLVLFAEGRVAKYRLVPRQVAQALVDERKA